MLVISRKKSESIMIGDDIEVIVTSVGSDRVKIGIRAPKGVPILRKELLETRRRRRCGRASASAGPPRRETVKFLERNVVFRLNFFRKLPIY